ncbi:helix-turn-helix protein [Sinorhizobium medicae]|uniref:helix-turn-helix domain-containing protein n=1 Tax=Sinorhizobium medicae TaxID=110321 RepID=UPI00119E7DFA|nr:helix-turn-helix transcriptional regulator [Sinorhizobium medicae]TWA15949.1 helix-turn-helix protein [Sinorhizobium medicae]
MDDVAEIATMIRRLEDEAGLSRRAIAEGAGIGASQVTRIMLGDAKNPSFRVANSLKRLYAEKFADDADAQPSRFAPGCAPRASR